MFFFDQLMMMIPSSILLSSPELIFLFFLCSMKERELAIAILKKFDPDGIEVNNTLHHVCIECPDGENKNELLKTAGI